MTDEELHAALWDTFQNADGNAWEAMIVVASRARELLAAEQKLVATRESVREWLRGDLPEYKGTSGLILAALNHFSPPDYNPPIRGMSVIDIEKEFVTGWRVNWSDIHLSPLPPDAPLPQSILVFARVAHRLAQPARDETLARECAFAFYKATEPDWNEKDYAEAWDREPEEGREGWRAVARVVGERK